MKAPAISVILPTFNRGRVLAHSIGSVLSQSWRDLELIVVDDGSTEDIQPVLAGFHDPRLRYIRRDRNGGVAAARNTGIHAATGEFLAFQDSDDEWLLSKLESQWQALGQGAEMVICGLLRVGSERVRAYPPASLSTLTFRQTLSRPVAYTQTWLVPRAAVVDAGGFDEQLRIWDDWELLVRLSSRLKIAVSPEVLVVSKRQTDSLSTRRELFIGDMERILHKHRASEKRYPAEVAHLVYLHARLLAFDGQLRKARVALGRALALKPLKLRPWMLLAASWLGAATVQRMLERRGAITRD